MEHEDHAGHGDHAAQFRDRFWLTLVLSVPVVVWAPTIQDWFGYTAPQFSGDDALAPVLGSIILAYGGWPFLSGAVHEIRQRQPGMMLLIGMAISVAYLASLATSLGFFDSEVWWELALLIAVMLLGHWVEMRAVGSARGALAALAEMMPDEAERVGEDGSTEMVAVDELAVGDTILVRPGGRVPADGRIADGSADLDESMITGESTLVTRGEGERVVAGTVVAGSSLRVEVDAVGEDTTLAGIQQMVEDAQQSKSRTQRLADRTAGWLFYVAVTAAAITAVVWALTGRPDAALDRSVTVLIIACPHALGLAIPLVTAISTSKSAESGILVKDRLALEAMRSIDTVLFDKTGTLTIGEHTVADAAAAGDTSLEEMLRLAGAVESDSEHPLARAIHTYAQEEAGELPTASGFESMAGRGVQATVDGTEVAVGGPALLRERELQVPDDLREDLERWQDRGAAILHVVRGGEVIGAIALEDQLRDASRDAVAQLHEAGVTVAMITGDAQQVADAVAAELGIDEVFAEVLPEDKDAKVEALQDRGRRVAMVGDGVNDAPALARADVGIAIGAGTDVAIESAGIILASDDPRGVVAIRHLSQQTYRKMVQNLWWAAGYNVVALPVAAGVLAPWGFILPIAVGAILMSTSTVVVALNAQLLRRVELGVVPAAG
ncbi:MAG: heavy metal translocating P-type ATPase [Acidimicrobiales bacterium]|nr:heavy metal translocating P-type ATPase [Acidimicrobiales bacterium]